MENDKTMELSQLIIARNEMLKKEKELYMNTVENINLRVGELIKNDFGTNLVQNSARDIAGETARRFFDFGDYYITVDQLYARFTNFSYDNDKDLLIENEGIRKAVYNIEDSPDHSETLKKISGDCEKAQEKLFQENRNNDKLDKNGKIAYRESKRNQDGDLYDELTGNKGEKKKVTKNGKECLLSDLHADHVQAREAARYNGRYIREDKVEKLKEFYNSPENMELIHASANAAKGDVRVCRIGDNIEYLNSKAMESRINKGENIVDITSKATAKQLADATITMLEKDTKTSSKIEKLKAKGYLDENGKVKPEVRKELERNIEKSQNAESKETVQGIKYGTVAKDAAGATKKSFEKILAGQIIYYVLPPVIFETKSIISNKNMSLKIFFNDFKKASKRITKYVISKLKEIFKNILGSAMSNFVKNFFDIIIEILKAVVKKITKIIKNVVMALVNCIKVLFFNKEATLAQKADAVTKILATTVTAVVLELLFEYLEKQFGLPNFLMEPLQIIVTVLSTNILMLVLQKLDLFDVQYGLLVSNIEKVFEEENNRYLAESAEIYDNDTELMEEQLESIKAHIKDVENELYALNIHKDDLSPVLEKLNSVFNMEIDFNSEWNEFVYSV